MSPAEILPAELLGIIFHLLVDPPLDRNFLTIQQVLSRHRSTLRALISTSHVCKRWRDLVLHDGTLWVYIPIEPSRRGCWEAIECFLKRSKQTELDISVLLDASHGPSSATITTMAALSAQYTRIRSLRLSTDSPVSLFCGSNPATAMSTLEIFNRSRLYYPVAKFGGTFPSLRSLTLHGFSSWPSDLFSNLTRLRLTSVSAKNSFRLSRLIDLLRGSPELETVYLSSYLSVFDDLPLIDVVHLRNLQKITLRACDSAAILSHVGIPRTSTLDIIMDHRRLRATKPLLSQQTNIFSSLPSRLSNIKFSNETTKLILEQDLLRGGFGFGLSFLDSSTSSLVVIDCSRAIEKFVRRSLDAISSDPYFEIVRSVTLTLSLSIPIDWQNLLGRFKRLVELNTSVCHGPTILTTLTRLRADGTPLCPSLKRIRLFENSVGYTIFNYGLLQLLSDFRFTFHCEPINITVHDPDGHTKRSLVRSSCV